MNHLPSAADQDFRRRFEAGEVLPADFNHRAHLRLAYVYLCENDTDTAHQLMQRALWSFIERHGIDPAKYHETITRAWVMAVRHFMENTLPTASAESFIEKNPVMLNPQILLTHYSAEVLYSDEARAWFVEPNLAPIPRPDLKQNRMSQEPPQ